MNWKERIKKSPYLNKLHKKNKSPLHPVFGKEYYEEYRTYCASCGRSKHPPIYLYPKMPDCFCDSCWDNIQKDEYPKKYSATQGYFI